MGLPERQFDRRPVRSTEGSTAIAPSATGADLAGGTQLLWTTRLERCLSENPAHAIVEEVSELLWRIAWDDLCGYRRADGNYIDLVVLVSAEAGGP